MYICVHVYINYFHCTWIYVDIIYIYISYHIHPVMHVCSICYKALIYRLTRLIHAYFYNPVHSNTIWSLMGPPRIWLSSHNHGKQMKTAYFSLMILPLPPATTPFLSSGISQWVPLLPAGITHVSHFRLYSFIMFDISPFSTSYSQTCFPRSRLGSSWYHSISPTTTTHIC